MDLGLSNKKSPWWLWVILGVLMVVVGLGSYVYGKTGGLTISDIKDAFSKAEVKTEEVTKVEEADTTVAEEEATAPTIPADWKTYTDDTYDISFRYPSNWPALKAEAMKETDEVPAAINQNYMYIDDSNSGAINTSISITSFSAYRGEKYASVLGPKLDKLVNVYNTKSTSGLNEALWLPPSNAGIIAATAPKYIENADKSWRGFYYYAQIGQDDPNMEENLKKLGDIMVIMTDGTDKVVQIHKVARDESNTETYTMSSTCLSGANNFTCEVGKHATDDFENIYKIIATSIKTVDETASWKTYNNSNYGFSFKYPADWTEDKTPVEIDYGSIGSVSFTPNKASSPAFNISVFSSISDLPIIDGSGKEGKANASSLNNYFSQQKLKSTPVKIGSYNGNDVNHPDIDEATYYYLEHSGKVYVIHINSTYQSNATTILSTLHFAS